MEAASACAWCKRRISSCEAFASVERLAQANFKNAGLFLEKYVEQARHIEVQIFGDGRGGVLALGERDCSVQRRNQKVIEETPAPNLRQTTRQRLFDTATRLAQAVRYRSAGTVEFIVDAKTEAFYFLEVNTRLQVEHGVTEEVTGVDLVEWMVRQAAGDLPPLDSLATTPSGVSMQVRLYAEDPGHEFQPCSGLLTDVAFPADARVETWVERGTEVPPFYDPMIAKLIVKGADRLDVLRKLHRALADTRLGGIETNLEYLRQVTASAVFAGGRTTTSYLSTFEFSARRVEVIEPGVQSSIQDWPGRLGFWDVGVPPSGPMDALSLRLANRLLGNAQGAAALECTAAGPTLKFHCDTMIAICGAHMQPRIDGSADLAVVHARREGRLDAEAEPCRRRGIAHVRRGGGRFRCARLPRQQIDFHARALRRSRGANLTHRRHAARRLEAASVPRRTTRCRRRCCLLCEASGTSGCCMVRTVRPIFLRRTTSTCFSRQLGKCITTRAAPACA